MDNLTCAILKVKSDKGVVYIRRPEAAESDCIAADRGQISSHLASKFADLILPHFFIVWIPLNFRCILYMCLYT